MNKLIPKTQKGMKNSHNPKYNIYSANYGIETLNDDIFEKGGTETITTGDGVYEKMYFNKKTKTYKPLPLSEVTIRPDDAPDRNPSSAASVRESYRNIILGLRNQGYNNWADAVEHVNQYGGGVGNAVAWYQGSVARYNDLLNAQQHANIVRKSRDNTVPYILTTLGTPTVIAGGVPVAKTIIDAFNVGKPFYAKLFKDALVGTAGSIATNEATEAVTGKTFDQHMSEGLQEWGMPKPIADNTSPFLNIGGWMSYGSSKQIGNSLKNGYDKLSKKVYNKFVRPYDNYELNSVKMQIPVFGIKNPKPLNDWQYSITDDIKNFSKNTENLFKRFIPGIKNNYQNHTLKKIPVSSEFKTYLDPTLQRLQSSQRSYIEDMVPNIYLETDNLLSGKNSLGYWDKKYIKLRKTVPKNHSKAMMFGHEARHAIDDEVQNVLTNDQINMINDAYDWNNLDLVPNYKNIDAEKVTTNVDARNLLFDSYHDKNIRNYSVDQQNQIIDSYSDQAIVDFVQKSNGYGQRYINYLKKNNQLTPEKINKFREAMKYVPILGGLTFLNQNKDD